MPSFTILAAATLGLAHVATANFQPRGLLARQEPQPGPTTDTDGDMPNIAALIPAECQQQCSAYAGFAQGCLDPSVTNTDECSCKKEVMDAFLSCVPCFPAIAYDAAFSDKPVTIKQYVQESLDQCAAAGYPIQGINVDTLPTSAISVSIETIPPESRTDITYSSSSTSLIPPVTRASTTAGGPASSASSVVSRASSAAGSVASSTASGASSALPSTSAPPAGSAVAFARISGTAVALVAAAAAAAAFTFAL